MIYCVCRQEDLEGSKVPSLSATQNKNLMSQSVDLTFSGKGFKLQKDIEQNI